MSYHTMRTRFQGELRDRIERMLEDGEIDSDEADRMFEEEMEDWDYGYGDMMYDIMKDEQYGY